MKIVAIVCEYNPFHLGHLHQIREIRRTLGEDTAIVAVMSGNLVQRGDLAILGKFDRARMAIRAGVSLVLELPFPYSAAGAAYFTEAAVSIATRLGVVDMLSFGSEAGDIDLLTATAKNLASPAFEAAMKENLKRKDRADMGYAALRGTVYRELFSEGGDCLDRPNDILALGYLSALQRLGSPILPHTVKRTGTDADGATGDGFAGATYIRTLLRQGDEAALSHLAVPDVWREAVAAGRAPVSIERLSPAILAELRLRESNAEGFAESEGGVYPRLLAAARRATSVDSLLRLASTKKYTAARLRRALLFAYFKVKTEQFRSPPAYTQVLGADERGRAILRRIRKTAKIDILTKPADTNKLTPAAREQAALSYRADSIYALASPLPAAADVFLSVSPEIG